MAKHDQLPKYNELLNPLFQALHDLGGSDTIVEISSKVSEILDLPENVLNIPHDPDICKVNTEPYKCPVEKAKRENLRVVNEKCISEKPRYDKQQSTADPLFFQHNFN